MSYQDQMLINFLVKGDIIDEDCSDIKPPFNIAGEENLYWREKQSIHVKYDLLTVYRLIKSY